MVKKEGQRIYTIRILRDNGDIEELFFSAPNDKSALYDAEKSFNREFVLLELDNDIPTLNDKRILGGEINE